jgi:competence protein ComEA
VKGFARDQLIIAFLLGLSIFLIGLFRPFHPFGSALRSPDGPVAGQTPRPWIIEVEGAVKSPGIFRFQTPPTPYLAIQEAGGFLNTHLTPKTPGCSLDTGTRIEAQELDVGSVRLIVSPMSAGKKLVLGIPIALNQAGVEDLAIIPGISHALAGRMVAFRESHGPFRTWQEVRRVKGIGPRNLESFRSYLTLRTKTKGPDQEQP